MAVHKELDEFIKQSGVKGMRWGVINDTNHTGGADGKPNVKVKRGKIGQHLDSLKRERQWSKVLKEIDLMSTKDILTVTKRVRLENSLKKLSKTKMATTKDKHDYLRRGTMSNDELSRKVVRLQAKDGLHTAVKDASKAQRDFGEKVVQVAGSVGVKYALTKHINPKDILDAYQNPKSAVDKAQEDLVKNISGKNPLAGNMANMVINKVKPKGKS